MPRQYVSKTGRRHLKDPLKLAKTIRPTPDNFRRNKYTPRTKGTKYHLGICQFWAYLFELNERLPRSKKMTDEEIKRQVIMEFPDRRSVQRLGELGHKGEVTVNYHRQLYNIGRLSSTVIPEIQSIRYGSDGYPVNPRTGKPLLVPTS